MPISAEADLAWRVISGARSRSVLHRRRFLLGAAPLSALIWVKMHQETRIAEPWPGVKPTRILIVEEQAPFASMPADARENDAGP